MASISYTKRKGKKGLTYGYRIADNKGNVITSKSGFLTKRLAKEVGESRKNKLEKVNIITKDFTLYELWKRWYELSIKPSSITDTTKKKYRYRGHTIKKIFGNQKANTLKYSKYQKLMNDYSVNVTYNYISRINSDIRNAIQLALRDKIQIDDFTIGYKINAGKKSKKESEKHIESISDYERILTYLENILDYDISIIPYLLYTLLKTGLRLREAVALKWEDINLDKGYIYTYRGYSLEVRDYTEPKTPWSVRYVPLDSKLINVLNSLKTRQETLNMAYISENIVFFDQRHGILSNHSINKHLKTYLTQLDINPKITATGTRHTYISVLLAKKYDIKTVAKIVGHKNTIQIRETYGHLLKEEYDSEWDAIKGTLAEF